MRNTRLALLGFILLTTPLAAPAQQFGDFTYAKIYGPRGAYAVTITGYSGSGGAVTIPDSVPNPFDPSNPLPVFGISDSAFSYHFSLTSVAIPGGVASIGFEAFAGCYNLTSVTFANFGFNLTSIGEGAFAYCYSLTGVAIPDSVTTIGHNAFANCTSLINVTIPGSVSTIGNGAFNGCRNLMGIDVDAANGTYSSLDGVLFDKSQATLIEFPPGKGPSYSIPASVANIGDDAFGASLYLTNMTIPPGVTNIAVSAFNGCTNLTAIDVDAANGVYGSLDGVLFSKSLTTLIQCPRGKTGSYVIPGGVGSIGVQAFAYCYSLTSVTFPGSVGSIGNFAFEACAHLSNVAMPNVTNIGVSAFENCIGLTSVTIPGDIQTGAFESCASLTNVTILNGVGSIGYGAFQYCHSLTAVTIPGSVTSIGIQAFANCTSLTNITMPGSVTNIGGLAFDGLKGVFFAGNAPTFIPFPEDTLGNETVYYLPGTTGWSATFGGVPARLWNPLMQSSGVGPAGFGFNITGTADIPIVVEAAPSLANPSWVPLQSLNLTNGAFYFSDPDWTNHPARFYRIRSP